MDHVASLVLWVLFVKFATCFGDDSCGLDIILLSDISTSSGYSTVGKTADVLTDDVNVTLEAHFVINITSFVQVTFDWYKDGKAINVSRSSSYLRRRNCEGGPPDININCSFSLPLSKVNDGVTGNYSLLMVNQPDCAPAWVKVVAGRAQEPKFSVFPDSAVSCSGNSSTLTLKYVSNGFPTPTYRLNCSDLLYESESGVFVLPPEQCCSNVSCQAVASNGYHSPVSSAVTMVVAAADRPNCQELLPMHGSIPPSHVFLVYPPAVANVDAYVINGTVALQYTAAGALAYSLHCNSSPSAGGVASRSNFSSASGNFTIPPLSCGVSTTCYAVASLGLGESIVSPVTLLLASICRPAAVTAAPVTEGPQNISLIVSTLVSITVVLTLATAIILRCRRRDRCLMHQSKLSPGETVVDIGMAQADYCTEQHCQKKLQESCSDNSQIGANPDNNANATFHQQGLCGQTPTYFYPPGMPLFTQPFVTKLSNSGDGTGSLETDGDDSSPLKTGQPSCSVSWVAGDYGVSNDPVSMPLERYPSASNSSTVIVISAGTVQLGNGNIMVINGCSNETDHVSVSLPDCQAEPTPEAEHTLVPGSWVLSDSSTLLEPHSTAFNDCLSPDVS